MERDVTTEELVSRIGEFIKERETTGLEENNTTNWGLDKFKQGAVENLLGPDEDQIFEYIAGLKDRYQPSSVNRIAHSIKIFFKWMVKRGYMEEQVIDRFPRGLVSVPTKPIITFTQEDYEVMKVAAKGTRYYALIVIGWNTGMRLVDCAALRWDEVDFKGGMIKKKPSKTEEHETVVEIPLTVELRELLEPLYRDRSGEYINSLIAYKAIGGDLSKAFERFLKKHGLYEKGKTFHAFRRSAISRWLSHPNADIMTVRHLSGHKNIRSLIPYFKPSMDKKKLLMNIE